MDENQIIIKINDEIQLLKNQLKEKDDLIEKLKVEQPILNSDIKDNSDNSIKFIKDKIDVEMANKLYKKIIETLNVGDKYNEFIKFMILKVIENDYCSSNDKQSIMMNIIPSPQIQLLWKEIYLKSKIYNQLCNLLGGEGVVNSIQYDQDELDKLNKINDIHNEGNDDGDDGNEITSSDGNTLYKEKHEEFRLKYLNTRSLYKQYFVIDSNEFDEILESNELNRHSPITYLMNKHEKDQLKEIIKKKRNDKEKQINNNNNHDEKYQINEKVNNKRKERDEDIVDEQPTSPILRKAGTYGDTTIFVKTLIGKIISILVDLNNYTVENLKNEIVNREGESYCRIGLVCGGGILDDRRPLSFYNITKYSTIHMVLKLSGC